MFADGEVYEGELKEGALHGKGRMFLDSGLIKDGEWKGGVFVENETIK